MENGSKKRRLYVEMPVIVCEWHQHVLPHIHRGIASRHLPSNGIKMIHFDAHPDLTFPLKKAADDCFQKSLLYDQLEIADWILPLFYEGHVSRFIWVKPGWADQLKDGKYFVKIGKARNNGCLRVDLKEDYFIEELLYSKSEDLVDGKDVGIQVKTLNGVCQNSSTEDLGRKEDLIVGQSESFILDIDLDFFSTYNPFKLQYSEVDFSNLAECYKFEAPNSLCEKDIAEAMIQRQTQLERLQKTILYFIQHQIKDLTMPLEFLNLIDQGRKVTDSEIDPQYHNLLLNMQKRLQEDRAKIDLELIHFAGMSSELPHHRSTNEEIEKSIKDAKAFLSTLSKPVLVTIARSTEDEYTPKDQVDYIQEKVIQMLQTLYGKISIVKDYENTDGF